MGLLRKNICPECGEEYSVLRPACPKCGARKQNESRRSSAQSDTARRGSPAAARHDADARWQLIFGLCLVAAVIIAVIILIVTTINGGYETYPQAASSPPVTESGPPEETPPPSPSPTPTPTVESITITFLGTQSTGFTMHVGDAPIQLAATIYPVETEGTVTWTSSNEGVCTVDENGLVSAVSSGSAKVYARCFGAEAECPVVVLG